MNITNTELAKMLYEDSNISFGMIDSPNIIITTGTIDYDNGSCDGVNKKARTIYANDKENIFHFGMILKNTSTNIQTISLEYLEALLSSNCLKRDDCIYLLFDNFNIVKTTEYFGLSKVELSEMRASNTREEAKIQDSGLEDYWFSTYEGLIDRLNEEEWHKYIHEHGYEMIVFEMVVPNANENKYCIVCK